MALIKVVVMHMCSLSFTDHEGPQNSSHLFVTSDCVEVPVHLKFFKNNAEE